MGLSIPWFYEVGDGKDNTEDYTDTPDNDIGDSEERVLAAHSSTS
jgi:hypothetical protein